MNRYEDLKCNRINRRYYLIEEDLTTRGDELVDLGKFVIVQIKILVGPIYIGNWLSFKQRQDHSHPNKQPTIVISSSRFPKSEDQTKAWTTYPSE